MPVCIREFTDDDVIPFFDAVRESVSHVSPWLPWCKEGYAISDAQNWVEGSRFEWNHETDYRFVIYDDQSGVFLGSVAINDIDYFKRSATLGYWVRRSALRKGVAKSASELALVFAFDEIRLERVFIDILPGNVASKKVAHHFVKHPDNPEEITIQFNEKDTLAHRYVVERAPFMNSISADLESLHI
ncbi:GNAT family N-acetyltransferase [Vibrio sp.]|uniref:N-acetyltransferase n=1 Tax=Vibrio viridaestus TaxID=2487322 RepID=A0A3N9TFC1_9VIBR|nr:GNAT family N-acetyltransferase [Vibrio viridaestus]MDC0610789.1 GNAT family N-acetyltransferase [Vibrio sp.]RQW62574.1 N-acetyltransferase [Vibrio viridaestus]